MTVARAGRIRMQSRRPADLGSPSTAISLAMGEPADGTPPEVLAAAHESLRRGRTRYEAISGSLELREDLARWLSRNDRRVRRDEVVPTHGASGGLSASILALVGPGDRVLTTDPTYSLYRDQVAAADGIAEAIPDRADGRPDVDRLANAMPGARMVVLCNPGNPTGYVYSREELNSVVQAAIRHGTVVLLDEAYNEIVYDGLPFVSGLDLPRSHVITCFTFSKTYAMTGWRLGYVVANSRLADEISLVHRTMCGPLNTFVQDAGRAALSLPAEFRLQVVQRYQEKRDLLMARLRTLEHVSVRSPQGAFYAFARIHSTLSSQQLAARFAQSGVLLRPGSEYGAAGEGYVRLSFATDLETLSVGLERFEDALTSLRQIGSGPEENR